MSRIYTKNGDTGMSSILYGSSIPKDSNIFDALGNTDELSASLGVAHIFCLDGDGVGIKSHLEAIQRRLHEVGGALAGKIGSECSFPEEATKELEQWIDALDSTLPLLREFVLPGGPGGSAHLHLSRAVCRRAERSIATLHQNGAKCSPILKYLNRLSDFLFVAARKVGTIAGQGDVRAKILK